MTSIKSKCELCLKCGSEGGFEMLLVASQEEVAEMTLNTISLGKSRTLCAKCCQDLILVGGLLFKWSQNVQIAIFCSTDGIQVDPRWRDVKNEVFTEMDLAENDGDFGTSDPNSYIASNGRSDPHYYENDATDEPLPEVDERLRGSEEVLDGEQLTDRFSWMEISESGESWTCKTCFANGFEKLHEIPISLKSIVKTLNEHELSEEHSSAIRSQTGKRINLDDDDDDDDDGEFKATINDVDDDDSDSEWDEKTPKKKSSPLAKNKARKVGDSNIKKKKRPKKVDGQNEKSEDGLSKKKKEGRPTNHSASIPIKPGVKNQWHICRVCGKYLVNDEEFEAHKVTHKDGDDLRCGDCSETFDNIVTLQLHRRSHEKRRKKTMTIVEGEKGSEGEEGGKKESETKAEAYRSTIIVGDGDEPDIMVKTPIKKRKSRQTNHAARLPVNGKKNQWKICPICGKFVVDEEEMATHMGLHVEENECNKTEKCSTCGQKFLTTIQLHEHSKIHREEDPQVVKFVETLGDVGGAEEEEEDEDEEDVLGDEETEKQRKKKKKRPTNPAAIIDKDKTVMSQWTICSVCGKYLVSEKALSRHMETHNETREMSCEFCQKKFQTRKTLYSHRKLHLIGDKFQCDVCLKNFSSKPNLRDHKKKIHGDGVRDKLCRFCSKEFWSATILREHERIHTNEKPYECKLCGRPFRTAGLLRKHVTRTHQNEKRYPCRICQRPFSATGNRKEHERNVHGIDKIFCPKKCGKSFRRNKQAKDHALLCTGQPFNNEMPFVH